ncbi:MAG: leucine--tRNA ligase [Candidatus Dormibacteria bacterium]
MAEETADRLDAPALDAKWRRIWADRGAHRTPLDTADRPYYNLMMFPYPSAEKLHVGNAYAFIGSDIHGRYQRLKGNDVFEPMGFDAFGIHSENYALKVGQHPATLTARNVEYFREQQLKKLGLMLDWDHEVDTTDPDYYRWTQWLFLQLFNAGLAEHREGPVNWCPSCLTVLADEQVVDDRCERCSSLVQRRFLKQWFLKTTRYAQEMLDALDGLDWSEKTKVAQRNWIGRSEGAIVRFELSGCARTDVSVFTTRPDTLHGATFLVIGADHPALSDFVAPDRIAAVEAWSSRVADAMAEQPGEAGPAGIDLGSEAHHPLTGSMVPVWAATYVLGGYGTGAIMAVPAHDQRDHSFAQAHDLPIVEVVRGGDDVHVEAHTGPGVMVASGDLDGLPSVEGARRIVKMLEERGAGHATIQYRLRDWLISRQRYWGPPIPIIHCQDCGPVGVPVGDLPVVLPHVDEFRPLGTGVSPLAALEDWVNVACPRCGGPGRRESDVSDNFLDSAWYFLRYPSSDLHDRPLDRDRTWKWLPVDMYIGGNEHAVLHLMYARFVMRALHELGHVPVPEPFTRFRAHGLLIRDGAKMSKNRGNVVNPDEFVAQHGADAFRLYLMFLGPFEQGGDFRAVGIRGMTRFLDRVWRAVLQGGSDNGSHHPAGSGGVAVPDESASDVATGSQGDGGQSAGVRESRRHRLIARVEDDISELRYNTAIAELMGFSRALEEEAAEGRGRRIDAITLVQLLAPFAPHITEELWERLACPGSIHDSRWPRADATLAAPTEVTVVVQVNGRRRGELVVPAGTPEEELHTRALAMSRVQELLDGRPPRRMVVVPDRIVNVVA